MGSHDLSNMADLRSVMCHLVEAEVSVSNHTVDHVIISLDHVIISWIM